MPEETANTTAKPSTSSPTSIKGLTVPFENSVKLPEGVDEETRLFHGVDPETKERVSVTLEGLKAEFGDKLGEEKYLKIAGMAGGSVFFNAKAEATSYRPSLGISGLKGKHKAEAEAILAAKE
jgi:hypothetical protein